MKNLNFKIDFTAPKTDYYKCSICGKIVTMAQNGEGIKEQIIYCPICGTGTLFFHYLRNN